MSDEPALARCATRRPARNASSAAASPWDRLASTVRPSAGAVRQRMARRPWASSTQAPWPAAPANKRPVGPPTAGASTTPSTGTPPSISAMLTVNSPLRLMNSRVPSSGSTSQKRPPDTSGVRPAATDFFSHHGDVGRQPRQASEDDCLGTLVGLGHGRGVVLAAHFKRCGVDGHDHGAGLAGQGGQWIQQIRRRRQTGGHWRSSHCVASSLRSILPLGLRGSGPGTTCTPCGTM